MTVEDVGAWAFMLALAILAIGIVLATGAWLARRHYQRIGALREYAEFHHIGGGDLVYFSCPKCQINLRGALAQFSEIPVCSGCGTQLEAVGFKHQS